MSSFQAASFTSLCTNSFPQVPAWAFSQVNVTVQFRFSSAIADFLYEVIVIFCIFERLKGDSALCVYCCFSWDIILDVQFPYFFNLLTIYSCPAWLLEHLL